MQDGGKRIAQKEIIKQDILGTERHGKRKEELRSAQKKRKTRARESRGIRNPKWLQAKRPG